MTNGAGGLSRPQTRRDLLRKGIPMLAAAGALPSVLAACGSSTSGAVGGGTKVGGALDFLSWEGYDLQGSKAMNAWRKQHGVSLRTTYIGTHDDIQAKLKSGANAGYDLITYYQGDVDLYRRLKILEPIDEAKVPNLGQLYPLFREGATSDRFWRVDGERLAVPAFWGTTTLDYRADKLDPPESWFDLLKDKYKGKVGWVPDATGAFVLGGRILGLNVPNYTPDEFNQVASLLRKFRAQTRGFSPSFGDLTNQLVNGEVLATFVGWAAVGVWARQKNANVKSIIPKEKSYSFADAFAVPPTVDNEATTLAFINQAISPKIQAQASEALASGVVTPDAVPLLSKDAKSLYPYHDLAGHFRDNPLYPFPPLDKNDQGFVTRAEWQKEWTKIQAGD